MFTDPGKAASQARIIVDLLRSIHTLRCEYVGLAELLALTLELNQEQAKELSSARERYLNLLTQHRSLLSGRTNAEERQELDEAA